MAWPLQFPGGDSVIRGCMACLPYDMAASISWINSVLKDFVSLTDFFLALQQGAPGFRRVTEGGDRAGQPKLRRVTLSGVVWDATVSHNGSIVDNSG